MKNTSIEIIEILKAAGHKAYWAGGCVRDMVLGIRPVDFDIVTSAKPDEIEALLKRTIPVGKEFGVILAIQNGHHFEVATFRSDSGYSDGRRPDYVEFSSEEEDAKRRDFTINSMFYDPTEDRIIDYMNGQRDIKDRLVRFIGNPDERILEDNLRILRAVRFKNTYGFQYHPETYSAIKKNIKLIKNVSAERIGYELNRMIMGANAGSAFQELFEIGALELIIPEMCRLKGLAQPLKYHNEGDVWDHSIKTLESVDDEDSSSDPLPAKPASLELKWAALFHDIGKFDTFETNGRIHYDGHDKKGGEIAQKVLKRLKMPRRSIQKVVWLIEHHMMMVEFFKMTEARRRHWFLMPGFEDLLEIYRVDAMGIIPKNMSLYQKIKKLYHHEIAVLKLMPKQLIGGKDIMNILNLNQGAEIGKILAEIKEKQLAKEINTKDEALEFVKKYKNLVVTTKK